MKLLATLLLALTACVASLDSETEASIEVCNEIDPECDTGGGGGDDGGAASCATENGIVDLDQDPATVDDADGKVTFCHATSAATNKFVVITTSVNACKAHEEHTKLPKGGERDVFPTGGCAD